MIIDEAVQTFVIESTEFLQDMESLLLRLEEAPKDSDTINALFRAAHTIKGSAGVVGIETVEQFTHFVESVLEKVRQGDIAVSGDLIALLLKCRDHMVILVELADENPGQALDEATEESGKLLEIELKSFLGVTEEAKTGIKLDIVEDSEPKKEKTVESENWHISLRFGPEVYKSGMDPISFLIYMSRLGEIVHMTTITEAIPSAEIMDPELCYLGFEIEFKSDHDKATIEDVFEFVREDCQIRILPPKSTINEYVELIQNLPEETFKLGEILIKGGALTEKEMEEALDSQEEGVIAGDIDIKEGKPPFGEIVVKDGMVHPAVVKAALEKQAKVQDIKTKESATIRVDIQKLDQLINLVGELVISNANINQHARRIEDGNLIESVSVMTRLVEEIREKAMKVRMVPIGGTFNRFNRVVHDICRNSGKDIKLQILGADTELDKTVVEKIADPLMHLVRNAADHGIEMPEDRSTNAKKSQGTLILNAYHDAGSIVIEVSDDGKGLNQEKILSKAQEKGLVQPNQSLTETEIFSLIFEPGFSTAEKVSKLSGRGVGMDVVKRNIDALRGTVEVESKENKGTTVRIRLPLTLAIIDGFMVGVSNSLYIIPLDAVVECVELNESNREISNNRHYVNLRGEVLPYIKLREFFFRDVKDRKHENIIVVQYAGNRAGLVVDELFGDVQAVIKSLGKSYKDTRGISGATIMGDGSIALILDVPQLVQIVEKMEK